jgi:hypothetical protein
MEHDQENRPKKWNNSPSGPEKRKVPEGGKENGADRDPLQDDPMVQFLKPLHNLPRGKNTWNPRFLQKWWFWPVSAAVLILLFYVYPHIWDFFAS